MKDTKYVEARGLQFEKSSSEVYKDQVLGYVERSYADNDKLILIINSPLGYNNLLSKLSKENILLIRGKAGSEMLIKVKGIEELTPIPPSIPGGGKVRVRLITKSLVLMMTDGNKYKYVKGLIVPTAEDEVLEPGLEPIKEYLNLNGNVTLGYTLINEYKIPVVTNDEQLLSGLLIVGQPNSGKTKIIMNIVRSLHGNKDYRNIVVIDRTGEYISNFIKIHSELAEIPTIYMPIDLAKLDRALDIDEVVKYVLDELKMMGMKGRVRVSLSLIHGNGIKLSITHGDLNLTIYPTSIRSRWFMEELINMNILSSDINYLILHIISKSDVSTMQDFINILQSKELLSDVRKSAINKTLDLILKLKQTGYFDAIVNVKGKTVKPSLLSPVSVLSNKLVIYDIHKMPTDLMNMYELLVFNNIVKWLINEKRKSLIILDSLEGLIENKAMLNELINIVRGKGKNTAIIISSRSYNRRLYHEVSTVILTRTLEKIMDVEECVGMPITNKHFTLISPALNIGCIMGSVED